MVLCYGCSRVSVCVLCVAPQVVFPLAEEPAVCMDQVLPILACHTSTQIWFKCGKPCAAPTDTAADDSTAPIAAHDTVSSPESKKPRSRVSSDPEICVCGLHAVCNHQRLSMLNDPSYVEAFRCAVDSVMATAVERSPTGVVGIDIADGSFGALMMAT